MPLVRVTGSAAVVTVGVVVFCCVFVLALFADELVVSTD